jgi:adenylate cyclase class 2
MVHENIEKEAKFYIRSLKKVELKIIAAGGQLVQPRILETNLRYDTRNRDLLNSFQVLRLRQDSRARLTYKGPADPTSTVSTRAEYEVEISGFEGGRRILESLGYEVVTIYEKYRASYTLESCEISLDEMPFGDFIEIEGPDEACIKNISDALELKWEYRSLLSYMRLFAQLKENLDILMRDLTFKNFSGLDICPEHLQLSFAD